MSKFSVITASFNSEKTIKQTIESVLNQSFLDFEYIIIDGKSTDKTIAIIKQYEPLFKKTNIPFKWISEKDNGIYEAFNKGIKLANGDWISFLGSDDYYTKNALQLYDEQINSLNENTDLVHSNVQVEGGKTISDKWKWSTFRRKMNIAHVGAFHQKNYFEKYGFYDTSFKIAGDYELLLRANKNLKVHWFNSITAIMGNDGVSNTSIIKVYKETTLAKIKNKSVTSLTANSDYFLWVFKYKVKQLLSAINR